MSPVLGQLRVSSGPNDWATPRNHRQSPATPETGLRNNKDTNIKMVHVHIVHYVGDCWRLLEMLTAITSSGLSLSLPLRCEIHGMRHDPGMMMNEGTNASKLFQSTPKFTCRVISESSWGQHGYLAALVLFHHLPWRCRVLAVTSCQALRGHSFSHE